jgi:hypothetical protein
MLRKTILAGAAALTVGAPHSHPPAHQRGGVDIRAGMDGIMAGSTGRRFASMPVRLMVVASYAGWCGRLMAPRRAGSTYATDARNWFGFQRTNVPASLAGALGWRITQHTLYSRVSTGMGRTGTWRIGRFKCAGDKLTQRKEIRLTRGCSPPC